MQEKEIKHIIRQNGLMLLNMYGVKEKDVDDLSENLEVFVNILYQELNNKS